MDTDVWTTKDRDSALESFIDLDVLDKETLRSLAHDYINKMGVGDLTILVQEMRELYWEPED
jgi:hypothetical protein